MNNEIQLQKGHPKGLYLLFMTELWERFSYYGMRAIFTLFMINALLFDKNLSSTIYGNYTGLVYLTPLIGGYVADRYWGNRRSILFGGMMMATGQFFMFLAGCFYTEVGFATTLMFVGLGFLIFGNGFFKPNISTMVGQLYEEGDRRVDSAFTIFYMGINLGAFLAPIVCGTLGEVYDKEGLIVPAAFKWGFLAACIGMIISTLCFELFKNKLIVAPDGSPIGTKPKKKEVTTETPKKPINVKSILNWIIIALLIFVFFKGILGFDMIGAFIYAACIVAPASIITDKSLTKVEKDRIWVIFIIAFFVIFFWSAFEQAGASLTYFAQEQTDRMLFNKEIPSSYFQSINAVAIVIFAPIFAIIWTKLGKSNKEPSSPVKQALGLFLLALGYLIIAIGVKGLDPNVKVSMLWLITLYTIHTFGELCLSPIGLSMVTKLAPVRFASLLMGVWFLSTATANKFAGDLSKLYPEDVKLESVYELKEGITINNNTYDFGKTSVKEIVDQNLGEVSISLAEEKAKEELSIMDKFKHNLFGIQDESQPELLSVNIINADTKQDISEYQKKLTFASSKDHDYNYHLSADNSKMYVLKTIKDKKTKELSSSVEVWNLNPKKPSFLGVEISSLYHFFMIFVIMAGTASLILFVLSKKLMKMMHGVK